MYREDAEGTARAEPADFSQWLPTNPDYKIAAGINVEMYSDASKFEQGAQDREYYCEVWIPVEKK